VGKHEISYPRIERDLYPTPAWVIDALAEHVDLAGKIVWEPAAGDGRMVKALKVAGAKVYCSDIVDCGYALDALVDFTRAPPHFEFLRSRFIGGIPDHLNIITNPPFGSRGKLACKFIEAGLASMGDGFLALLLPADFDSAKTRRHLFGRCPKFVGKIILTRRVKWFDLPGAKSPKENTSWFLWGHVDFRTPSRSAIRYAPEPCHA
jgi:hypothetical protein